MSARQSLEVLKKPYPWLKPPFIISAPMRVFAGAELAVTVSRAGGLGFIGPGIRPADLDAKLGKASAMLKEQPVDIPQASTKTPRSHLPIGVGFQLFDGDLSAAAAAVRKHRPIAAWLFVPAQGQKDIDQWTRRLREASEGTQIWLQVGSVAEALAAARSESAPNVLVLQGSDAGGHGLKKGAGVTSLIPEVADALAEMGSQIPLIGAGGIADGRGVAAVLASGAVGAVMGTRFLASSEAEIARGYQEDVVRVADGGQSTVRTTLFDRLQGRDDWPEPYDGRAVINASVRDEESGVSLPRNKEMFQLALKTSDAGWGLDGRLTTYVGSAVGLVKRVDGAADIVENARRQARDTLRHATAHLVG